MKKRLVNTRARWQYEVGETVEAGIVLSGPEVKSLRLGRVSLVDAFVRITKGEAYLVNVDIPAYGSADNREYDARRSRKLLLHRREIETLERKLDTKNMSLVPLEIKLVRGRFKVVVGVGKGRKEYEKRQVIRERDLAREVKREWKQKLR